MLGRRQEINLQLLQFVDFTLLAGCLYLSYWLRGTLALVIFPTWEALSPFSEYFWMLAVIGPFTPIFLEMQGFYKNPLGKTARLALWQLAGALGWIGLMIGFCEVFLRWRVPSRAVLIIAALLGVVALILRAVWVKHRLRRRLAGNNRERVLLAGQTEEMERLLENMTGEQGSEIEVVGRFDVTVEPSERLVQMIHESSVSRVIFAVRHAHFGRIEEAVQACENEGVEAWLSADFFQTAIARPTFDVLGGKLMLVFHTTPQVSWSLLIKEVVDRVGSLILLVLTAPLWLMAMAGILLSSRGPVLFRQHRSGRNGMPFLMFKLRTMEMNAEVRQAELEGANEMRGPVFKLANDPRVFPFGRLLRRLSIDELPQLINILRGEMSFVGPRPLPVYEIERIEKHSQRRRLSVKPGLTCLWQIMGRNQITSFEEWVALDLKYIDNWSLWLDAKILFQTLPAVLKGSGAH